MMVMMLVVVKMLVTIRKMLVRGRFGDFERLPSVGASRRRPLFAEPSPPAFEHLANPASLLILLPLLLILLLILLLLLMLLLLLFLLFLLLLSAPAFAFLSLGRQTFQFSPLQPPLFVRFLVGFHVKWL